MNFLQKHGGTQSHISGPIVPNNALASGAVAIQDGRAIIHQTVITLLDVPITITNSAPGDYGTVKLGSFSKQAGILILGGVASLTLTGASLVASQSTEMGIGTTAGIAQTTLATTYENLLVGATVASVVSPQAFTLKSTAVGSAVIDGTSAAPDVNLNIASTTGLVTADLACTISGKVILTWVDLGDV